MKTFYVSLLLLALLIAAILLNTCFIQKTTSEMLRIIESLPPCEEATNAVSALNAYWEDHKTAVGFSASEVAVCDLETRLIELYSATEQKNTDGFATAVRLTRTAILRIQNAEQITVENLF